MLHIYLVLGSVLLYAINSLVRKSIASVDSNLSYVSAIISQLLGGFSTILFSFILGYGSEFSNYFSTLDFLFISKFIFGSLLWFSATVTMYLALNKISMSKYAVIEPLSPLVSILLAFGLLGEVLTGWQYMGTFLIMISVFMVVYNRQERIFGISKAEILAMTSVTLAGIALVNDKGLYDNLALAPTLTIMWFLPGLFGILLKPKELLKVSLVFNKKNLLNKFFLLSLIAALSGMLYYKAIVLSNSVSLIVSIGQLSSILTVVLGLIFLKETKNWQIKILASIISVVGLIVITYNS